MHTKISFIAFFIFIVLSLDAQILIPKKDYVPEIRKSRYSFTVCLIAGSNSAPVSFGIYRQMPDSSVEVNFLNKETFVRQFCGIEESAANPGKLNFCKEYDINPEVFNSIWKLKYEVYPFNNSDETGWGTKTGTPSESQFVMLSAFGLNKMEDHCYGENLVKLLQSLQNNAWVGEYLQSK